MERFENLGVFGTSLESDAQELARLAKLRLDEGYVGDQLLPQDLGRLACEVAGLDMTYRAKPKKSSLYRRKRA